MFIFRDKTKGTWKTALKLRKKYKLFFELKSTKNESLRAISLFKTHDHRQKMAYMFAQKNNFQGTPEFYWGLSEKMLDIIIDNLEHEIITIDILLAEQRIIIRKGT